MENEYAARTPTVGQLTAEAHEAFVRGDLVRVRDCLTAALELSPGNGELALALGHAELSAGNLDAALAAYWSATLLLPKLAAAHSSRALALQLLGRSTEASRDAIRAISLDPGDAVGLKVLARIHLDAEQPDAARQACQVVLRKDAGDPDAIQMMEEAMVLEAKLAENLPARQPDAAAPAGRVEAAPGVPPKNGDPASPGEQARRRIQQFMDAGRDYFADVLPPQLTEQELENSRVIPSREEILALLPKGGVCAEIGTQAGDFAKQMLSALQPAKFHIYDLDFTPFDHAHFQSSIQSGQVELHPGDSATLLSDQPDHSLDLMYIDGDSSYQGAAKNLEQAARKIKEDGWIVCNNYAVYSPLEGVKYGVCRAVNEFCLNRGFEIRYLALHHWGYHNVALRKRST